MDQISPVDLISRFAKVFNLMDDLVAESSKASLGLMRPMLYSSAELNFRGS